MEHGTFKAVTNLFINRKGTKDTNRAKHKTSKLPSLSDFVA
jgi:hypothetical protein